MPMSCLCLQKHMKNNEVSRRCLINRFANARVLSNTLVWNTGRCEDILRRERRIELAGERSRYFDLVRWGILIRQSMPKSKFFEKAQPVKDYHILLPIPQSERDANPLLNAQVNNNWN